MLSKSDSKFIKSLQLKKYRKASRSFVVEGAKNLLELSASNIEVQKLFLTEEFFQNHPVFKKYMGVVEFAAELNLIKCGSFTTNNAGIAICEIPQLKSIDFNIQDHFLAIDNVRDPGNLGTIIRIADWYGMPQIICSESTADCYNPKVINSTMGSFCRVQCHYVDLEQFIIDSNLPVIGAGLNGANLHHYKFPEKSVIVMGNESSGISKSIEQLITEEVTIPGAGKAESLNVSTATAIFCDHLFKQKNRNS
ncbi:MAG: RNA methyltransferase [Cyclobacteriaceae bacterium]